MKPYQFLLFDLDYTLLDFGADMIMAFEKLYKSQDWEALVPYSPAMLELYESINESWWRKFENGQCSKPELFRNRFADFLLEAGLSGNPNRLNESYFSFLGQGGVPYPGALDMVKKLSRRSEVYIITNGNAATARTRTRNSGLLPLIKGCFVSETIGFAKPDPRYFQYVFSHIPGFRKDRAVVIGDSPVSDIQGARNAGIDSLWYHADHRWDGREVPCTYEAGSYAEIVRILTDE